MPQIVLMDTQKKHSFNRLVGKFSTKAEVFFSLNIQNWKKHTFSKKIRLTMFLWTQRKALSTNLLQVLLQNPTISCSKSASNKIFFLQTCCFNKVFFLDTWKAVLTNLLEFFRQMPENFCSLADSDKVWHFFQREQFSSQCSYGNVECAFDNSIDFLNK